MNPSFNNRISPSGNTVQASVMFGVEVCIDGAYGGICDVGWDDRDARVACNEVGFTEGELLIIMAMWISPAALLS